jgi:hypothetical protein
MATHRLCGPLEKKGGPRETSEERRWRCAGLYKLSVSAGIVLQTEAQCKQIPGAGNGKKTKTWRRFLVFTVFRVR